MLERLTTPLIALVLALLAWMYMHGRSREVLDDYPVPVDVRLAPGQDDQYLAEVTVPAQVRVAFSGPRSQMRKLRDLLRDGEVRFRRVVSVPEDRAGEPVVELPVRLDANELGLPPGIDADVVRGRDTVPVVLRQVIERRLRVELRHTGGDRVERPAVEPETALVRGPREVLDWRTQIPTQVLVVPEQDGEAASGAAGQAVRVPLVASLDGQPVRVTPPEVSVTYRLRPREKVYEVRHVPVRLLCPADFPYRVEFMDPESGEVTVKVRGPAAAGPPAVTAYIDLAARPLAAGMREREAVKVHLPRGYHLAEEPPAASLRLVARTSSP